MPYIVHSHVVDQENSHVYYAIFYEDKKVVELYCDTEKHAEELKRFIYCLQILMEDSAGSFSNFDIKSNDNIVTLTNDLKSAFVLMKNENILSGWFINDIYDIPKISQVLEQSAPAFIKKKKETQAHANNYNRSPFFSARHSNNISNVKSVINGAKKPQENTGNNGAPAINTDKKNHLSDIIDCVNEDEKTNKQCCLIL